MDKRIQDVIKKQRKLNNGYKKKDVIKKRKK